MNRSHGFTLLELMIAIMMFAMISTAAYKLFESVSRAQQVTDGILERLDVQQRAQLVIEKDLFQLAARSIRDEFGDRQPALRAPASEGALLAFTRSGWRNPLNEIRSDLQRVRYEIAEGKLIRSYWQMLDRAPDPVQIRQVLMDQVQRVRLRFMDEKKNWRNTWPPEKAELAGRMQAQQQAKVGAAAEESQDNSALMPVAIELTVQHPDFGTMTTILPVSDLKQADIRGVVTSVDQQNVQAQDGRLKSPQRLFGPEGLPGGEQENDP